MELLLASTRTMILLSVTLVVIGMYVAASFHAKATSTLMWFKAAGTILK